MKNIYSKISLNIIVIFSIAILASFIPDHFREFFGDTFCHGNLGPLDCQDGSMYTHGPTFHWGYRHILWTFMGGLLGLVQTIKIINSI